MASPMALDQGSSNPLAGKDPDTSWSKAGPGARAQGWTQVRWAAECADYLAADRGDGTIAVELSSEVSRLSRCRLGV